jgi:hypothetical protein
MLEPLLQIPITPAWRDSYVIECVYFVKPNTVSRDVIKQGKEMAILTIFFTQQPTLPPSRSTFAISVQMLE